MLHEDRSGEHVQGGHGARHQRGRTKERAVRRAQRARRPSSLPRLLVIFVVITVTVTQDAACCVPASVDAARQAIRHRRRHLVGVPPVIRVDVENDSLGDARASVLDGVEGRSERLGQSDGIPREKILR